VDVNAGVDVVKHIPADVVGILVDNEIIGTIPAPICAERPIPGSDFKAKAAREPETVMRQVKALDAIAVGGAKVLEAAMLEGMIEMETLIVRTFVAVPMIVVDVLSFVDVALDVALDFGLSVGIVPFGWRRGDVALIGTRRILCVFYRVLSPFLRVLGKNRNGQENCDGSREQKSTVHSLLLQQVESEQRRAA